MISASCHQYKNFTYNFKQKFSKITFKKGGTFLPPLQLIQKLLISRSHWVDLKDKMWSKKEGVPSRSL